MLFGAFPQPGAERVGARGEGGGAGGEHFAERAARGGGRGCERRRLRPIVKLQLDMDQFGFALTFDQRARFVVGVLRAAEVAWREHVKIFQPGGIERRLGPRRRLSSEVRSVVVAVRRLRGCGKRGSR